MTRGTAFVTGGSRGLGLATVHQLVQRDYQVAMVSRDEQHLADALQTIPEEHRRRISAIRGDVRDLDSITEAAATAARRFGGIDAVIACAGVSMRGPTRVADSDPLEWRRIMSTNLDGTYHTVRATLPYLERASNGRIVTVLSTGAWSVDAGKAVYAASKFGARALTEGLIAECRGSSVRVSSISPGPIDTTIWTHKTVEPSEEEREGMLRPNDVADMCVWLLERPERVHVRDIMVTPWVGA